MKVIYGIGRYKNAQESSVAVGVFDGVHRGHQAIIKKVVAVARSNNLTSIIVTFSPHPDAVIHPKKSPPSLISFKHRLQLMRSFGVDFCIVLRFTAVLGSLCAETFIQKFLVKRLHIRDFVVSSAFGFGKDKKGNLALLQRLSRKYHFNVHVQRVLCLNKYIVSSTLIRSLIAEGKLNTASQLLGRRVEVLGTVVAGERRGRRIGFPTANIDPHHEIIPPRGVYIVNVYVGAQHYHGLVNIGLRPTFKMKKTKTDTIELHILNFHENLYGRDVKLIFLKKIRNERAFLSAASLTQQIRHDIRKARLFFASR